MAETELRIPTAEEVSTLESSVADLTAQLASATDAVIAAGRKGNFATLKETMSAAEGIERALTIATRQLANATALVTNRARLEARDAALADLRAYLADSVPVMAAFEQGCTRIDIVRTAEGQYEVNVATGLVAQPRQKGAKGKLSGIKRPRAKWMHQGNEYSSRELLEQFGGDAGKAAIRLATKSDSDPESWVNKTSPNGKAYQFNPGFYQQVIELAEKIGATKAA